MGIVIRRVSQKRGTPHDSWLSLLRATSLDRASGVLVSSVKIATFVWALLRTADREFASDISCHDKDGMRGPITFAREEKSMSFKLRPLSVALRLQPAVAALLVLSACVTSDARTVTSAPPVDAATAADLGGSARVSGAGGMAGEGEGYATAAQPAKAPLLALNGAMPAATGAIDHGQIDHSAHGSQQMAQAAPAAVQGRGVVRSIDSVRRKVNISHDAIPAIGWPPMTMDFDVAPAVNLGALKPEMHIDFTMRQEGSGMYFIQTITSHGGH